MRLLSSLVGAVIVAVAAVLLTLFALENTQVVSLSFLGSHFSGNIWWLVLGAAAIGFLLALLVVVPGHMATSHRASQLSQINAEHEHDLAQLRDAHAQIQAQRDRLTAEHARVGTEMHTLRDELATARGDRDAARQEREQVRAERDQLRDELAQMRTEREQMGAERDQLRERLAASPAVAPVNADGYRPTVEPALMGAVAPAMVDGQAGPAREDKEMASRAQEQTTGEPPMPEAVPVAQSTQSMTREDQMVSSGAAEPEMPTAQPVQQATTSEDQVLAREPVVTQPAHSNSVAPETETISGGAQPQMAADEAQAPQHDVQEDVQDHEQSTLGERLRALFHTPEGEETPAEQSAASPEQPVA